MEAVHLVEDWENNSQENSEDENITGYLRLNYLNRTGIPTAIADILRSNNIEVKEFFQFYHDNDIFIASAIKVKSNSYENIENAIKHLDEFIDDTPFFVKV